MPAFASIVRSALGSGERLAPQPPVPVLPAAKELGEAGDHDTIVFADPAIVFQEIMGFGAAFTEAAAFALSKATPARQDEILRGFFSSDPLEGSIEAAGHGYRLCRVHMGSCDFALGNWTHAEKPRDYAMASFSIECDRRWLLPLVKRARAIAGDGLRLFASPWSPPAWMKTNGMMNRGGKLLPECRAAWALYFVRFIEAWAAEGVPIWGVTIQNEPEATQSWDSCIFTAEEERDFIRDHLAPALDRAGLSHIEIIGWDHNRDVMVHRAAVYYADAAVRKRMWGVGFHWYVTDTFDNVRLTHDAWPEKHLLFTEGCQEGGPHPGSWDTAERYARSMINDLNRWTVGWVDWNLCLDASGGPNHVGNLCSAPVMIDAASGAVTVNPSWSAIGHFSRYVKPGARRVLCASPRDDLETAAFSNPDGSVAVVVLNRGGARKIRLQLAAAAACAFTAPARSLLTVVLPPR